MGIFASGAGDAKFSSAREIEGRALRSEHAARNLAGDL
jgi:hypothetical protein